MVSHCCADGGIFFIVFITMHRFQGSVINMMIDSAIATVETDICFVVFPDIAVVTGLGAVDIFTLCTFSCSFLQGVSAAIMTRFKRIEILLPAQALYGKCD